MTSKFDRYQENEHINKKTDNYQLLNLAVNILGLILSQFMITLLQRGN